MLINILQDPSIKNRSIKPIESSDGHLFYIDANVKIASKEYNYEELSEQLNNEGNSIYIEVSPERQVTYDLKIKNHHLLVIRPSANILATPQLSKHQCMTLALGEYLFFPIDQDSNDQLLAFDKTIKCFSKDKQLSIYNAIAQPDVTTRLGMLEDTVYNGNYNYNNKDEKSSEITSNITKFFQKIKISQYLLPLLLIGIFVLLGWLLLNSKSLMIEEPEILNNNTPVKQKLSPAIYNSSTADKKSSKVTVKERKEEINTALADFVKNYEKNPKDKYKNFYTNYFESEAEPNHKVLAWVKIILDQYQLINKENFYKKNHRSEAIKQLKIKYKNFSSDEKLILNYIFCKETNANEKPSFKFGKKEKILELPVKDADYCNPPGLDDSKTEKILTAIKNLKLNK